MTKKATIALRQTLGDVHGDSVDPVRREIYTHSHMSDDEEVGVDYRQAVTFVKNINTLNHFSTKLILVHLHTIGGCWNNGMAMFNAVEFSASPVTMLAYAQASSMSGIILQSASSRIMMPDCHFLMHFGSISLPTSHPFSAKAVADREIEICRRMLEIFARRAIAGKFFAKKKSSNFDAVYNFFDKKLKKKVDWYLTAEQTVYYGLADHILGDAAYPTLQSLKGAAA